MGDVVNGHLCQRFIEEFGFELEEKEGIAGLPGGLLLDKNIDFEYDAFEVRMHYVIRDTRGDEYNLVGTEIYFHPDNDFDDLLSRLVYILLGNADVPEASVELLRSRLKKVYE